jgi:hypothetical protein
MSDLESNSHDEDEQATLQVKSFGEMNSRQETVLKEQFLESLKSYKHVAPRIGKYFWKGNIICIILKVFRYLP